MAENAEQTTPAEEPKTPTRRVSRRATAAAGTPAETTPVTTTTTAAAAETAAAAPSETPAAATAEPTASEAAPPKKRATRSRKKVDETATADAADAAAAETPAPGTSIPPAAATEEGGTAPKRRVSRSRKKADDAAAADAVPADAASADATTESATESDAAPAKTPARRRASRAKAAATEADTTDAQSTEAATTDAAGDATTGADAAVAADGADAAEPQQSSGRSRRSRGRSTTSTDESASEQGSDDSNEARTGDADEPKGRGRGRGRGGRSSDTNADRADASETAENTDGADSSDAKGSSGNGGSNGNNGGNGGGDRDGSSRSSRTRQRDRKRRGQGDDAEFEISEDDVLLPIAGILDVLDNYAFVRTSGYVPGTNDVYVSLGQVKKYGLRKGDAVVGAIRQPRDGDGGGRQKYNAIVKVDSVNGRTVEENQTRNDFDAMTPTYPQERLLLETSKTALSGRLIDLVAPIGKGQRALIIGERGTGKSQILRDIAESISTHAPDAHLMAVLIDERPEEATDLERAIKGEVVASTFDRSAEDHTTVAELSIERAKRLAELGHDVVVLLSSITALGRAFAQRPVHGRVRETAIDTTVFQPLKQLLGAARKLENGGSLTIVATAVTKTGSKSDRALLRELAGTANSELHLSSELAESLVFPAIDVQASYTLRDDLLVSAEELRAVRALRAELVGRGVEEASTALIARVSESESNAALLARALRG